MLEDISELIEEAPTFVIGLIVTIVVICVGGNMAWNYMYPAESITPPQITTPIISNMTATVAPTVTAIIKPTTAPTTIKYETFTDEENIPGATFKRATTDQAGVYYGTYYNENCVYIKIEDYYNGSGKVNQVTGELKGLTIHTRFGMNVNSRYDPAKKQINSLLADPFKLYLEYERRGLI